VSIRYVEVSRVEDGPGVGLLEARPLLDGPFFLFLGDECHFNSRHDRLLDALERRPDVLFTYTKTFNPNQIRASFGIEVAADGRVESVEEKPRQVKGGMCGCGTLYLTPAVLDALATATPSPRTGRKELWEVAASFIGRGTVLGVDLDDPDYVNVNTIDDLHRAIVPT
jgi:dTDP-glucose pyrophosphorylase